MIYRSDQVSNISRSQSFIFILDRVGQTTRIAKTSVMAGLAEFKGDASESAGMPFIVSSDLTKVDPATRRLIRSHVMRGKKAKKGPPRDRRTTASLPLSRNNRLVRVRLEDVSEMYTPLSVGRVGSDLSFIEFADDIEQSLLLNMAKGS